jgi:hypothetical protein
LRQNDVAHCGYLTGVLLQKIGKNKVGWQDEAAVF